MGLMDTIMGGGQQASELQGFVQRYEQGAPSEGYSDQEVVNRYQQVAPQLQQDQYVQAAEQAFNRLSPQQRQEFGQLLQQQAQSQGVGLPMQPQNQQQFQEPGFLAQMTGQLHQQQPGLLGQLLGGNSGGGSLLSSPVAKAALAGVAAMAVKNMMGGGGRAGSFL